MSAIHIAIEAGRSASVQRLLDDGESVDSRGTLDRTPLHVAAEQGRTKIVELLLERGATVDAKDYRKNTPLHLAARAGAAEVVGRLLEAGAKAGARNVFKSTPLHEIANGGGNAKGTVRAGIVELLLDAGCPKDARDSSGRTALWFAAATGTAMPRPAQLRARLLVLETLLDRGANPRLKSNTNPPIPPIDAAMGLHQSKRYRQEWPDAIALLTATSASRPRKPRI